MGSTNSQIYSMRAECSSDINRFVTKARQACLEITMATIHRKHIRGAVLPDIAVQFESNATIKQLQYVLHSIVDSHVMLETLRACPLAANSLERQQP